MPISVRLTYQSAQVAAPAVCCSDRAHHHEVGADARAGVGRERSGHPLDGDGELVLTPRAAVEGGTQLLAEAELDVGGRLHPVWPPAETDVEHQPGGVSQLESTVRRRETTGLELVEEVDGVADLDGGESPGRTSPNDCSSPAAVRTRRSRAAGARCEKFCINTARQPTSPLSQPRTVTSASNELPCDVRLRTADERYRWSLDRRDRRGAHGPAGIRHGVGGAAGVGTGACRRRATRHVSGGRPVSAIDPSSGWSWPLEQLATARATHKIRASATRHHPTTMHHPYPRAKPSISRGSRPVLAGFFSGRRTSCRSGRPWFDVLAGGRASRRPR